MPNIMTIFMSKIGTVLDSRPAGREALLAMRPHISMAQAGKATSGEAMEIIFDFRNVEVLTPSFADEFITPLLEERKGHVRFVHTHENITVKKTLEFLSEDWPKVKLE
jgi:hypothetical protein